MIEIILAISIQSAALAGSNTDTLVVQRDGTISISVNGVAARARVDPSSAPPITLDQDIAERAEVRTTMPSVPIVIGPVSLSSRTGAATIAVGSKSQRRVVTWYSEASQLGADAIVSPIDLPFERIRFELNPVMPGEKTTTLPLSDFRAQGSGFGLALNVKGLPLRVFFRPTRNVSLATATAGSVLAEALGGNFDGPPAPMVIAHGVERPVRPVSLGQPLEIGPLTIKRFSVRVADYGETRIAQARSADPGEVVVIARSKRDRRYDWLTIGADDLAGCSSLTIDKRKRLLILNCR